MEPVEFREVALCHYVRVGMIPARTYSMDDFMRFVQAGIPVRVFYLSGVVQEFDPRIINSPDDEEDDEEDGDEDDDARSAREHDDCISFGEYLDDLAKDDGSFSTISDDLPF